MSDIVIRYSEPLGLGRVGEDRRPQARHVQQPFGEHYWWLGNVGCAKGGGGCGFLFQRLATYLVTHFNSCVITGRFSIAELCRLKNSAPRFGVTTPPSLHEHTSGAFSGRTPRHCLRLYRSVLLPPRPPPPLHAQVQREHHLPRGDFPDPGRFRDILNGFDLLSFPKVRQRKRAGVLAVGWRVLRAVERTRARQGNTATPAITGRCARLFEPARSYRRTGVNLLHRPNTLEAVMLCSTRTDTRAAKPPELLWTQLVGPHASDPCVPSRACLV